MSRRIQRSIDNKFDYGTVVVLCVYVFCLQYFLYRLIIFSKLMKVSSKILILWPSGSLSMSFNEKCGFVRLNSGV